MIDSATEKRLRKMTNEDLQERISELHTNLLLGICGSDHEAEMDTRQEMALLRWVLRRRKEGAALIDCVERARQRGENLLTEADAWEGPKE